jgi:hypothetical protein
MKKILMMSLLFSFALSIMGLHVGVALNGNMQDGESYFGVVARNFFGIGGLELGIMPKLDEPLFDFTSYRIIVSPSLGWGTPELRAYVAVMPYLQINQGNFDFDVAKWNVGAGANFMVAPNVYGFFEFFVGMDFNQEGFFSGNSYLTVGFCYRFNITQGY